MAKKVFLAIFVLLLLLGLNLPAVLADEGEGERLSDNATVSLTVNIVSPTPPKPPGGNGGNGVYYASTDYCGVTGTFPIDYRGKVIRAVEAGCKGGALTITIEKGTTALGENGRRLPSLTIVEDTNPPPPPEGDNIIGIPYELGPAGATFDPPLTFTWTYDPEDLPEGVAEEDLVLAYYDKDAGKWVTLECVVDIEANTVTAKVSHFTTYALVSPAARVAVVAATPPPPPPPTLPEPTKPTPPEPTKPTPPEPTPPTEPIPQPSFLWLYIVIGVGVLVIIGCIWAVRRRRSEN